MRRFAASLFVLVVIAAGCASSGDDAGSTTSTTATSGSPTGAVPGDLFVQNAASARFTASDDGSYQLTLTGVDAEVVWFSDRPARQAGTESTADLMTEFFADPSPDGPPNAAVVWSADGDEQILAVTLQEGAVDADSGDVIYTVTLLETSSGALADFGPNSDVPTSPTGPVSLFIDSGVRHEVCQVQFFNGLDRFVQVTDKEIDYGDEDDDPDDTIYAGTWGNVWSVTASTLDSQCGGRIDYVQNVIDAGLDSPKGVSYIFENGSFSSNSWSVSTEGVIGGSTNKAVVVNLRNDYILSNHVILCESSVSDEDCIAMSQ